MHYLILYLILTCFSVFWLQVLCTYNYSRINMSYINCIKFIVVACSAKTNFSTPVFCDWIVMSTLPISHVGPRSLTQFQLKVHYLCHKYYLKQSNNTVLLLLSKLLCFVDIRVYHHYPVDQTRH